MGLSFIAMLRRHQPPTEHGLFVQYADMLSLSSHKMYGPKGLGVIYISRELHGKIEPVIYGGGQQNGCARARSLFRSASEWVQQRIGL